MIQRIQTIFLALVVILGVVFSFVPIISYDGIKCSIEMNAYNTYYGDTILLKNMGVGVMQGLVLLVALATIFMFKNRSLQMKLGKFNILLVAFQIAAIVMYNDSVGEVILNLEGPCVFMPSFEIGAFIPVISLVLTYLAIHFIKKDDKMVRAADRLR